jgi:hypothetical protein
MPKRKGSLDALRELGYTVGFAHGSVAVEEEALTEARNDTSAEVLAEQAAKVTTETMAQLNQGGLLPDDPAKRRRLVEQIADTALRHLTERAEGRVAFHQDALAIAKGSPDVWVISGPGVTNVYVACKPDGTGWDEQQQELLDALGDPRAHAERVKQHEDAG